MSKRFAVLVVTSIVVAGSIAVACSFPDVEFATAEAGPGVDPDTGARSDGPTGPAPPNPDVDPDGGSKDATSAGEAAVPIDAAGCVTCDCDHDGFNRLDLATGCDGGPPGKTDCDDVNAAIHPGQGEFLIDPWPSESQHKIVGDWDCSGTTTKQFTYNAACGLLSTCANGFVGNPRCGETADFITCGAVLPIVGCAENSRLAAGMRVQGCH
jgi:hypothetical protein